ncbi:FAD-binding protein [Paenibacillus glycinis]|uniref:FAD-binding protein n=1 Tax=Paenibacillus glycinis TaxID=2697035 RepID=A0ABW9XQ47_9BACL|nr:FAD-binding protein [Paenibacillus glycinis]NBD24772.1 FAD-binding protein [Paenibacillus glycinis]
MITNAIQLQTDVLIIGAGAAGMMAARAAADEGADVILSDKSLIGRGGATILAQMTVAVALGEAEEDSPDVHFEDTMKGSRGLADPSIVRAIVDRGPEVILEAEGYGVKWARTADGRRSQAFAPGHSRARCVYVDILNTGGATVNGLKRAIWKDERIRRLKNVMITKIVVDNGRAVGAVGFDMEELRPVGIAADSVILATGGLTEVYERNSASTNMTGDGFVLAAEAGAELRDMEMVQFFPIAHLYPPLVGIDPIMWDPFRYKLGGRLLNGEEEEFMHRYNGEVAGKYTAARDQTTLAIFREVEAGRGTPHGGAYLDFRMVPEDKLKEAFGPVIEILRNQGVDLTRDMVEVAPMAHFMLGGVRVDEGMRSRVPGLLAAGELIYGMHGANRLSGNAITEALVTGRIAGETAARERNRPDGRGSAQDNAPIVLRSLETELPRLEAFWHPTEVDRDTASLQAFKRKLQAVMWKGAGPLRTEESLTAALAEVRALRAELDAIALAKPGKFALPLAEKLEAANMLQVGEAIVLAAIERRESRGAHVRLDYEETLPTAAGFSLTLSERGDWRLSPAAPAADA